ncbi:MAG: hypothetical protein HOW73_34505 [Polyangiaceae bacterium]|nr:hypothetical protein [Polyangiaceae bacterium]
MDRRSFLRTGALGGGGVAALSGCSTMGLGATGVGAMPPPMSDADIRGFLARLDDQMDQIQAREPLSDLLGRARGKTKSDDAVRGEDLARKSLRSLLLAGSFSDLPLEARVHPAVQRRMFAGMAEMDESAFGMRSVMHALTPTERADMSRALRDDPELAMNVVAAVDEEAARIGVSQQRRLAMRTLAAHVSSRMKQSSPLFLDDCVRKFDKLASRDATVASLERQLIAQMGEDEFFRMRDSTEVAARTWLVAQGTPASDAQTSSALEVPESEHEDEDDPNVRRLAQRRERDPSENEETPKLGTPLLTVGGILMGMSLVYIGVGLFLVLGVGTIAGAFLLTHGGLVFIGGLVTLILGGIRRANS